MADDPKVEDERRIAELLRVNGELATEIRDLVAGRRQEPRRGQTPAARSVAKLQGERDSLSAELDSTRDRLRVAENERDALLVSRDELEREVARLRSGLGGVLRRARARLFRA